MPKDDLYPFVQSARVYPLGTDIGGATELDYALTTVSGRTSLAHRLIRRLTTPRGGLWYAPNYGFDLSEQIGSTTPLSVVEQRVVEQMLAEEEVADARATATFTASTGALTVEIQVVDADGPFELVLTASELTFAALMDGVAIFESTRP